MGKTIKGPQISSGLSMKYDAFVCVCFYDLCIVLYSFHWIMFYVVHAQLLKRVHVSDLNVFPGLFGEKTLAVNECIQAFKLKFNCSAVFIYRVPQRI